MEFQVNLVEKNTYYLKSLNKLDETSILPGILKLFEELTRNNVSIIIASISKNAPYILEKLKLNNYVYAIANPAEVKNSKPAPDIFLEAAKLSGFDKKYCVGIEDSVAGIEALNSAKIKSIGIGKNLTTANCVLEDTSELNLELIQGVLKGNV